MKQFQYYQDEKVSLWIRSRFAVNANSREEAEDFIREKGLADSTDWHYDDFNGRVEFIESTELLETQEEITVEMNGGVPTIEVLTEEKKPVADNCGNRTWLSTTEQWRNRALDLIKQAFPRSRKQKRLAFVNEYWDSLSPDGHNLFNFEKWLHGGDPLHQSDKPELWAYIYHMDLLDRNASDAKIVAYHEHKENWSRDHPVEALTPDEFACRVNDEQFNDIEFYVRFIKI